MRVTIEVETEILMNMLDDQTPEYWPETVKLGLVTKKGDITPIGQMILDACDQVALRHKILQSRKIAKPAVDEFKGI